MDGNSKTLVQWDWENLALLGGKESELSKPARQHEWRMVEGAAGGIGNGTLYSSGSGACSGSELGNCSSKSSISASMDCSSKAAIQQVLQFNLEAAEGFPRNLSKSKELARVEDTGTSPVGRGDPPIGLKLGKRTYFEDVCAGNIIPNPSPSVMPSTTMVKRRRVPDQSMQTACCQVEGCNVNLTTAKDYHRKHRVCENHSKSPKVIVAGQECRFCQQCSRFHDLSEFDQKKRSCRKRLSDHNARRRKPQPETISFNSSRLSSSFYETSHLPGKQALPIAKRWFALPDDRQQMNLLLSRAPFGHMQTIPSCTGEGSGGFKLTQTKESWIKSTKSGGIDGMLHLPGSELSNNASTLHHGLGRLLPFKGNTAEVLSQGLGASLIASNLDGAPDLRCALSLLSTDSCWGLAEPGTTTHNQFVSTDNATAAHPAMHGLDMSSGFGQDEQPFAQHIRVLPADLHSHASQFQQLKTPYEDALLIGSSRMH